MGLGFYGLCLCFYKYPAQTDNRTLNNEAQSDDSLRLLATHHMFVVGCYDWSRVGLQQVTFGRATTPQKAGKIGPISARQQNAIRMVFRWRTESGPRSDANWVLACNAATCHAIDHIQYQTNRITSRAYTNSRKTV